MTFPLASRLNAVEIHQRLAGRWPAVLAQLGIAPKYLTNKHGPCPACGGTDRYRFDDKHQRGGFYCNQCGAGDGFKLLQLVHGWSFTEARAAVLEAIGGDTQKTASRLAPPTPAVAGLTEKVRRLLRTSTTPDAVPDVLAYLRSRSLWPLPPACTLRAHVGVDYYRSVHRDAVEKVGRFAVLVGVVRDIEGEVVTAHVTYLQNSAKLSPHDPRKFLSTMTGRRGCAVRLLPLAGDVLGIGEGIETALAASKLHSGMPVWAALNATMLAKFVPPPEVRHVVIFADRDVAGLEAAWALHEELDGRCTVELRTPPAPANDWADVLEARR